jgi:cell division septation protein DedD
VERTATHDTEYVDIVLGYRHILLFSLVFGALIFGTGYFAGYQSGQKAESAQADSTTAKPNPSQASPPVPLPPVQVPAMLTEPITSGAGNVVEELEELNQESLAPGTGSVPEPGAAAPAAEVAPPPAKPRTEEKPAPAAPADEPEKKPVPQARAAPGGGPRAKQQASGNVYLQVSSFGAQQEAEQLIDALAAEGFRALIDGQLIGGKHTVLVGPFADFKAAAGKAKELRRTNREAFPIRR